MPEGGRRDMSDALARSCGVLPQVKILDLETVTEGFKNRVAGNPDVVIWLGKVGYATRPAYLRLSKPYR